MEASHHGPSLAVDLTVADEGHVGLHVGGSEAHQVPQIEEVVVVGSSSGTSSPAAVVVVVDSRSDDVMLVDGVGLVVEVVVVELVVEVVVVGGNMRFTDAINPEYVDCLIEFLSNPIIERGSFRAAERVRELGQQIADAGS